MLKQNLNIKFFQFDKSKVQKWSHPYKIKKNDTKMYINIFVQNIAMKKFVLWVWV